MKDFIPFEEAFELKQLEFDEPCFGYYDEEDIEQQVYEYANCSDNVTGGIACYHEDFLSVTNSQLDEYGAFGAKDDDGLECYERWTAPTFSQAFRFFREKYDLDYSLLPESSSGYKLLDRTYNIVIYKYYVNMNVQAEIVRIDGRIARYNKREEAELACLRKLIQIVKQK